MDWVFRAKNIKKEFRTGHALVYNDELVIKRHCMTFITADSGVGKSTLLHMLGLLDRAARAGNPESDSWLLFQPDTDADCREKRQWIGFYKRHNNGSRGTIPAIGDEEKRVIDYFKLYNRLSWRRRSTDIRRKCFGFLPQQGHLLHHLSLRENLELVYRLRGRFKKNDLEKNIAELLKDIGLKEVFTEKNGHPILDNVKLGRSPTYLSGGEAQRLAVARTLICSPGIIFVDEPTTFFNERLVEKTIELLVRRVDRRECSVIIVTHQYKDFFKSLKRLSEKGASIDVDHFSLEMDAFTATSGNTKYIRVVQHESPLGC